MLNDGGSLLAAHFSDLHYSPGHLAESDRCFGFAVEDAIASRCHVAVVSGDSTDHRLDAHTPALSALARRIHQLSARMRWTVNEEHRQLVDREAIQALFGASAEVKLEARVLPAVRSRAEGISRAATLSEKLGRWCELTGVDANPLLDSLSMLENLEAQAIADQVLAGLAEIPIPATQEVHAVEAAALPFVAKLGELELDETVPVPKRGCGN